MNSLMYKSEYTKMYHSEEKLWWYICLRKLLYFYVKQHSNIDAKILDAGCGTGKNIEFLKSLGYVNIQGFDYSEDAIRFCKMRGLDQVNQSSIIDLEYNNNSFDVIYCMDVIGCLYEDDRAKAISELYRVLKPGGILVCNSAALNIFGSQHDDVGNIKIRFTKHQFLQMFENYDFQLLKLTYRIFLLSPLVLLFKMTKNILRKIKTNSLSQSDQIIFPFGINWVFLQIQLLENQILKRWNLPFGSSVFIVLKKL